jgi:uncharacterized protein (TIGR03437 family)
LLAGYQVLGGTAFVYADDGQLISDGNGNLSVSSVANLNGNVASLNSTGTYSVGSNCIGSARISNSAGTIAYQFAIAEDGQAALFFSTTPGYVVGGIAEPQFSAPQSAVVNSGSFAPNSLSPGSLFSIFGDSLASQTATAQALPLPGSMAFTQVLVNGEAAPLVYVSPTQINAQMPLDIPTGRTVSVQIRSGGQSTNIVAVNPLAAAPGIFTYGANQAIVQNPDGGLNSDAAPAHPGDILVAYLTGGGPVNAAGTLTNGAGSPAGLSPASLSNSLTVGGQPAAILYLGLTPTLVGVYQVNFRVPTLAPGRYAVVLTVNGVQSNGPAVSVGG